MQKKIFTIIIIIVLFVSTALGLQLVSVASANPDGSIPTLAMPVEYVNYTISRINGTLWAKIDGNYPIYILSQSGCAFSVELPMVYPMPPQTRNIHVWLGDQELSWSNYTQSNPGALHHTAIGDWWMIYSVLRNVSGFFVLKIHYEHPLEAVNGSNLFLYDLNISPYLSSQSTNSTAYFTVRMEANTSDVQVYTTETDVKWNPARYSTTKEGSTLIVEIQMRSEFDKPLLGDLVVVFSESEQVEEFNSWIIPVVVDVVLILLLLYIKRKKVPSALSSRKTSK
jgi:hypothetical protein